MAAPKLLCGTKDMSRERWLECRAHGPRGDIDYTIGGSDVSVVFGENPWTAPLELWRIKKGMMKPNEADNANQKLMGQLMEPLIAYWYEKLTGNSVIEDNGLYQHTDYPYALANLDYRIKTQTGEQGVLECKTTSWHKAGDWADGSVPHYYELQVRFYLAVMDLEFADIACLWGTNPESDMVINRITRNRDIESMIFETLDDFINKLRTDQPPDMAGVNPELAMKALARIYAASVPDMPTIEFAKKYERPLRRIAALQADNIEHDRKVRENEKEVTALSVKIAEIMGEHERGVLETDADKLLVNFITKSSRRVDTDLLKKDYRNIYDSVLKTINSRKVKVEVHAI